MHIWPGLDPRRAAPPVGTTAAERVRAMRATPLGRRGAAPAACAALLLLLLAAPPTPASSVTTPQVARPLRHSGARWRAGGNGSAALLPARAPRGPAGRALSSAVHARLRTAAPRGGGGGGSRGAVGAHAPPPRQPLAAAPPLHPVERASRARECLGRVGSSSASRRTRPTLWRATPLFGTTRTTQAA